jgi:hypothetical protein
MQRAWCARKRARELFEWVGVRLGQEQAIGVEKRGIGSACVNEELVELALGHRGTWLATVRQEGIFSDDHRPVDQVGQYLAESRRKWARWGRLLAVWGSGSGWVWKQELNEGAQSEKSRELSGTWEDARLRDMLRSAIIGWWDDDKRQGEVRAGTEQEDWPML